ncbi:uncharacterized protein LOC136067819 [Quercus suber]|uniref:uncharacterized protein LOC136067819 n=1 Tax=Quercus suber TaxID=58331 RepID=UPI0032DF193E
MQKEKLPSNWIPPPQNCYKINVDRAVFATHKMAGVGILIQDANGKVIGACSKKIMAPLGAIKAEAKAFEIGLQFTKDLLIQDFVLEGDSLILVKALKELLPPPFAIAALFIAQWLLHRSFVMLIYPMSIGKAIS